MRCSQPVGILVGLVVEPSALVFKPGVFQESAGLRRERQHHIAHLLGKGLLMRNVISRPLKLAWSTALRSLSHKLE